jgi:predicted alpha/beta-fold hydrolase
MSVFGKNVVEGSVVKSDQVFSRIFCVFSLCLSVTMLANASSADAVTPILTDNGSTVKDTENGRDKAADLSSYHYPYTNGLYATLAGYLSVKDIEIKQQKVIKLQVPGFKSRLPVRAIIQPNAAPLVIVLLGLDGEAKGKLGKLWPSWYAEAGYHVLTFDSTFLASFIEISGHGVTGNLVAESERVRDIISAFIAQSELRNKVTKIGIVGMSYGGLQALLLAKMATANTLPFKLDAVQCYSPPINIQKTGERLDGWYANDRWNYTLIELADKMAGHKPVDANQSVPFDDGLMRAGIAAIFRLGLVDVITRNDRIYKMNILPSGSELDSEYIRRDYAATWGFSKFMTDMAYTYWKDRMKYSNMGDLINPAHLETLLASQPVYSETILAEDDPFNDPVDVAAIVTKFRSPVLTVLPRGGHLGYVNDPWTKAKLLTLFKTSSAEK